MENWKGRVIRGYELRDLIGIGGFGVVYRAYQAVVDREVAIKIILPQYANKRSFIRNFEHEARLVARLEHPHIVPLYDFWRDAEGAYIVMRYIRGGNLQESLKKKGRWELAPTVKLLEQIGAALAEAHRNSVIHQDIKAANILLDEQGNAYLTDFGISKDLMRPEGDDSDTPSNPLTVEDDDDLLNGAGEPTAGMSYGSPEYMAPEQILNMAVDSRSDIYSLGVLLYEILTGVKPFIAANDDELVRKQLYEKIPSLQALRPELPANFDIVIQRATEKHPKRRYTNPITMAENFREFYQLTTITSPAPTAATPQPSAPTPPPPKTSTGEIPQVPPVNPYKGLRPFQEADAQDFFGREKVIETLYLKTLEPDPNGRFLAVIGPSGSGKSSVVLAGLVPMMRKNLPRWFIVDMTPGEKPLEKLAEALRRIATDPNLPFDALLLGDDNALNAAVHHALGQGNTQLVLVIDQFEEVFTQTPDERERERFLKLITHTVMAPDSRLRVIITLRADFYDRPLQYSGFSELISRRQYSVSPMTVEELERAIVKPAERVGLKLEEGLASAIISEVSGRVGTLPLLQFALTELYDGKNPTLTVRAFRSKGGVIGAMTTRADELYASLSPEVRLVAQQFFLRLVVLGEGTEDTRRRVLQSELNKAGFYADERRKQHLQTVLSLFGNARLLAFAADDTTREPTIEIAHEALIRQWGVLRSWLNENRELLRLQRQLGEAAASWKADHQDRSYLARGMRLEQLAALRTAPTILLSDDERAYLDASLKARDSERQRSRIIQFAVAVTAVVMFVLALFAFYQRGQAEIARDEAVLQRDRADVQSKISFSREMAITALTGLSDLDKALLLSVEAYQAWDTTDSRNAMLTALQQAPQLRHFLQGHTNSVRTAAYSPDGTSIVTGGVDQTVRFWDAVTGQPHGKPISHPDIVQSLVYSADGTALFSGSADGAARRWDAATGELVWEQMIAERVDIWRIVISPDNQTLATAEDDGAIMLLDTATGAVRQRIEAAHTGGTYALAYSPDGRWLVSGGQDTLIRFWDAATGEPNGEPLAGHTNWVWSVAFSPDGALIASASFDETLVLWNAEERKYITSLDNHENRVRSVLFNPLLPIMASAGDDGRVILWSTGNFQPLRELTSEGRSQIWAMAFSPDGTALVTVSDTSSPQVWNWRGRIALSRRLTGLTQPVFALAFSAADAEGSPLQVVAGTNNLASADAANEVHRWSVGVEDSRALSQHIIPETSGRFVTAIALNAGGTRLYSADASGTVIGYDTVTNEVVVPAFQAGSSAVIALAISPDEQWLATSDPDGSIYLWKRTQATDGAGAPDGITWAAASQPLSGHIDRVLTLAFSPDGRLLASGSLDTTVRLWDVAAGVALGEALTAHTNPVMSLAFSPDGQTLASGGRDRRVILWTMNPESAQISLRQMLNAHGDWVTTLMFSPDGRLLASGSRDLSVILWDLAEGRVQQIGRPLSAQTPVFALAFSPDNQWLAYGGEQGELVMWQVSPSAWTQAACRVANRNLSADEWATYFRQEPYHPTCALTSAIAAPPTTPSTSTDGS